MSKNKQLWVQYKEKLQTIGLTQAALIRRIRTQHPDFKYPRAVGFFNGYWDLRPDEMKKIDKVIEQHQAEVSQ
jgi:hypothetical protein